MFTVETHSKQAFQNCLKRNCSSKTKGDMIRNIELNLFQSRVEKSGYRQTHTHTYKEIFKIRKSWVENIMQHSLRGVCIKNKFNGLKMFFKEYRVHLKCSGVHRVHFFSKSTFSDAPEYKEYKEYMWSRCQDIKR